MIENLIKNVFEKIGKEKSKTNCRCLRIFAFGFGIFGLIA